MYTPPPPVLLKSLTAGDAASYADLYRDPAVNHGEHPFLEGESDDAFLARIASYCEVLSGIALPGNPGHIIGDCALHHWDEATGEIEIGGALRPEFQGRGIMRLAFQTLISKASAMGARRILGRTAPDNMSAIRLVKSLGFRDAGCEGGQQVLVLDLR